MAINADSALVRFYLRQQESINDLIILEAAGSFDDSVYNVKDGARPHLDISVSRKTRQPVPHPHTLLSFSPFLNPVVQA